MTLAASLPTEPDLDLLQLAARFEALATDLAEPRANIEAAFLTVGDRLGQASTLLNRIVAAFAALPRDLDSPEMAEAIVRLGNIARRTREIGDSFVLEKQDVERLVAAVDAATNPIVELKRAVKMMGILAINARIVAAGLNGAADHFDVFTMDIANLSDGAKKAVEAFSEGHGQLLEAVHGASNQLSQFEADHFGALTELVGILDQGLAEVSERRDASAQRSTETVRVSREITARVANAVMALQVGDATRQRVEHSETTLTDLAAWSNGSEIGGIAIEDAARLGLVSVVLDLQEVQLGATIEAFNGDIVDAEQTLIELASHAAAAIAECRKLYGGGGQGKTSLATLGVQMQRAAVLLRGCAAERSRLDQMAGAVDQTVEVLLGHVEAVQEIEANMRLVGLNAAVKCAQLGPRGASLSVIAAQLRELTSDLVPAARGAVARLEEAMAAARSFSAASNGKLAQEVAQLEDEAMASIALLETVDQRLGDALTSLGRDGPEATAQIADAAQGLGGHARIIEALTDAQFKLADLLGQVEPQEPAIHLVPPEALKFLRKRYSMEAERRIHDDIVAHHGLTPPAPEPVVAPAASAVEFDLDFALDPEPAAPVEDSSEEVDDVLFF